MQGAGLLLIRFSAGSLCQGPSWCRVKIFVDGVEAKPETSTSVFDNGTAHPPPFGVPHSIDRSIRVPAGKHTVQVWWGSGAEDTVFSLIDWSLTVERAMP